MSGGDKVIGSNAESLMEEVQAFFNRSASESEGAVMLKKHCSQVFGQLIYQFDQYEQMVKAFPSYAATALIGLVKFDKQIDGIFGTIVDDEALLEDYTIEKICNLKMVKIHSNARILIDKLVAFDNKTAIVVLVLVWMVNKKFKL